MSLEEQPERDVEDRVPALRAEKLSKSFAAVNGRGAALPLFRELDLDLAAGEMVAIVGRSGTGKSSLLHLLAGLEKPTSGKIWIGSTAWQDLSPEEAASVRNKLVGYVWQFHYLLPEFSAAENIALPLMAGGASRKEALVEAQRWLERVELGARADHRAGELSGGEQQRVAIARALVTKPTVLLADEPTGDLDDDTARTLFDLLRRLCREQALATLLVTHNHELAGRCDRTLRLIDGRLEPVLA